MRWQKIKAGSYGTHDGWNAWRRSDGAWNLRSPRGAYARFDTLAEAKEAAEEAVADDGTAMESRFPRDIEDGEGIALPSYGS